MSTWIGLDPSITAFGYAVMRRMEPGAKPSILHIGTWRTNIDDARGKLEDRMRRVLDLARQLNNELQEWGVADAYVEGLALGMKTGRATTQTLGRIRGMVEGVCFARGVHIAEVRPDVLKQAVTGHRNASKEDVARVVRSFYAVQMRLDDNATDALAAAHVGAYRGGAGVTVTNNVVRYAPQDDLNIDD